MRPSVVGLLCAASLVVALPVAAQAEPGPSRPTVHAPSARSATSTTARWRAAAPSTIVIGRSVLGRPIVAHRRGPATAPRVLLLLGQMHGSEPRGRDVVAAMNALAPPPGVQVWTISTMNPDGSSAGRRTNAHGVDLNRNFPYLWSARYSDRSLYFPGRAPGSEPEVRAMMAFLDTLRPDLVVSLHQHFDAVDLGAGRVRPWSLLLASAMRLRTVEVPCSGPCTGTMTGWYNATHPGCALTIELPASVPHPLAAFYARAIRAVSARLVLHGTA